MKARLNDAVLFHYNGSPGIGKVVNVLDKKDGVAIHIRIPCNYYFKPYIFANTANYEVIGSYVKKRFLFWRYEVIEPITDERLLEQEL